MDGRFIRQRFQETPAKTCPDVTTLGQTHYRPTRLVQVNMRRSDGSELSIKPHRDIGGTHYTV